MVNIIFTIFVNSILKYIALQSNASNGCEIKWISLANFCWMDTLAVDKYGHKQFSHQIVIVQFFYLFKLINCNRPPSNFLSSLELLLFICASQIVPWADFRIPPIQKALE